MTISADATDPTGTLIGGRYEILRVLGQGAFGSTFVARDRSVERRVAIKVLDQRGGSDWKARELFQREGEVLRGLRHHGIPEVHDVLRDRWQGTDADFLVMEYIEGVSLQQFIDDKRAVPGTELVHLFLELLGIVDYLHRRVPPILHRDIKPANIIVRSDGEPALVDFGSVRRETLGPDESGSTVAGTYGYMPYEQYMGQAGPSSDLYALGATFLHLMTGRPPRAWMTDEGVLEVPSTLGGDGRMGPVLSRMLRRSPTERFASAHAVREAMWHDRPPGAGAGAARIDAPRGTAIDVATLGSVPRTLEGRTAELLDRLAPTAWQLADTSSKEGDSPGGFDIAWTVFFAVISLGIIPMVFISMARQRRRRLARYLRDGVPATAEIVAIQLEDAPMSQKLARVSFEFEADGRLRRDSDLILPVIAARWIAGDRIQVLYIPGQAYDSVIISTD